VYVTEVVQTFILHTTVDLVGLVVGFARLGEKVDVLYAWVGFFLLCECSEEALA
jgi:hypothetical protein